jgi:hypothetical protein
MGGPGCKSKKTQGVSCKKTMARRRLTGTLRLTWTRSDLSRRLGIRRPWCIASAGRRRPARRGFGAGVLQSPRKRHLDDDVLPADSTADTRGGDDGARRRTASGGGARPASPFGCFEARGRAQSAPGCSSPPRAAPGVLQVGGEATDGGFQAASQLGFARRRRSSAARVQGEGRCDATQRL